MSAHEDTIVAWLKEAATDLTAPLPRERMASALKWTSRIANVKGVVALTDRALRQQEMLELQCRFRADGMPSDAAASFVMANGPSELELSRARAEYSTAVELLELAERIARLLERPRRQANNGQPAANPRFGVQQGGKR